MNQINTIEKLKIKLKYVVKDKDQIYNLPKYKLCTVYLISFVH